MSATTHHLAIAVAIADQRNPIKRALLLKGVRGAARAPVLAWLKVDEERARVRQERSGNGRRRCAAQV